MDLHAAIRAALADQDAQEPGYGVGVKSSSDDERFVQWCRSEVNGGLTYVDVCVPEDGAHVMDILTGRGFAPNVDFAVDGLWTYESDAPLDGAVSATKIGKVVADLVCLLVPGGDGDFHNYP